MGSHLRYLGVELDSRTRHHFRRLQPNLRNLRTAAAALGGLLPKLSGPSDRPRRLYAGIVTSMALYGAPVWAAALSTDRMSQRLLSRAQRTVNLRIARAYRTVSTAAAGVLAGVPPLDLRATELRKLHEARRRRRSRMTTPEKTKEDMRKRAREDTMRAWKRRLREDDRTRRNRTVEAILPVLEE